MSTFNINTIMIIDDDTDDSELFCESIYEISPAIHCLTADNGQAGLLLLKKTTPLPDVIFIDLNMPRMNGKQCLAAIKQHDLLREIPVIIYTTFKIQDDVNEVMQLGAFDFITKPFRHADIKKTILKILDNIYQVKGL